MPFLLFPVLPEKSKRHAKHPFAGQNTQQKKLFHIFEVVKGVRSGNERFITKEETEEFHKRILVQDININLINLSRTSKALP